MISALDHINIETTQEKLEQSIRFYTEVLGLTKGWRPNFGVDGAWLYVDEQPIIHLVVRATVNSGPTGAIHHVALKASGLEECKVTLAEQNLDYQETVVPDLSVTQLFVKDPNNVVLELNFYADSVA